MSELPPPPISAEVDVSDSEFMPLNVLQLLESDTWLMATGDEAKACVTLWCRAWREVPAGSLPNNSRVLSGLSGAGQKWRKVRDVALRGFVECSDGRLYHALIVQKAKECWDSRMAFRRRTESATKARWNPSRVRIGDRNGHRDDLLDGSVTDTATDTVTLPKVVGQRFKSLSLESTETQSRAYAREAGDLPAAAKNGVDEEAMYAFEGHLIRLTKADFDLWAESFYAIPDLRAELAVIDAKFVDEGIVTATTCLGKASAWLRQKHDRLVVMNGKAKPAEDNSRFDYGVGPLCTDQQWRNRLQTYYDSIAEGKPYWDKLDWGEPPGSGYDDRPGLMFVPPHILAEFRKE